MSLFSWSVFSSPSTLKLSRLVNNLIETVPIKRDYLERIQLGLHEALVNAVIHGNEGRSSKNIRIRRIVTPNWLVWQIQDQGKGIPLKKRTSLLPSELEAESGRGLFFIHQCFDDVRWSNKGNRIQVACKRN